MLPVVFLLLVAQSCLASDQRCLLDGGGSTDTFFVREDSPVGAEVGRIRVNGEYIQALLSPNDLVWIVF